jgi:hypothetical protein
MDEATLTQTLRSIAADAPLHPAPSADARRRASRLRRNRRSGAAGLAVVVALALVGTVELRPTDKSNVASIAPSWVSQLTDPDNPNHSTTGYIGISRANGGEWIVYWQGGHLCFQTTARPDIATHSECASVSPSKTAPMTVANIGSDAMFVSVAPGVALVEVRHPDGSGNGLSPNSADGFPYRVVVAQGQVVSLRAMDSNHKQIGPALAGSAAPQLRPVLGTFDCSDTSQTGFDLIAPQLDDPKSCYGLAPIAMTFVPKSAQALDDPALGWTIQIRLDAQDQATLGQLTQRATTQPAPRNQLAIVFDGKVLSAPTIEAANTGGVLRIFRGATPFTEDQARTLAIDLGGG